MIFKEQISEFLKPDDIWEIFGVKSQEDFVNRIITQGIFHNNVPNEIQRDYKIVERLQFYSYYNYPLVDEAFGKATRIFEASIDIKISNLGLQKQGFESLNSKIKKLEEFSSNELNNQWIQAKKLRNIFAHHKAGRLMGATLLKAFKHNINMINSVFLEKTEILAKEQSLNVIMEDSKHLKKGLFIMEFKGKPFLISSIVPYTSIKMSKLEKSFWVFHPVYGEKIIKEVSDFPDPFMLSLKNVVITKDGLSATIIDTDEDLNIIRTDNVDNLNMHDRHLTQMMKIDLGLKQTYWTVLGNEINKGITDFIYEHSWK